MVSSAAGSRRGDGSLRDAGRRWWVLGVLSVGLLMVGLDTTVLNVALPTLARDLHSGTIPPENGMVPEILGERGWNTSIVGKWHLCPTVEMNLASTRRNWPTGRGFERFYGFLGAETNQWYPDLVYDNHPVDQPKSPEEGYHFTEDITDKAMEFIKDAKAIAPGKPFFLYYPPGACHAEVYAGFCRTPITTSGGCLTSWRSPVRRTTRW